MKILEFRHITTTDRFDSIFDDGYAWSRGYEYPLVLDTIAKYFEEGASVHNTSWGSEGIHITFKDMLDAKYNAIHSDVIASSLPNTSIYDITTQSKEKEKYDVVINVSTVEHINSSHNIIYNNLLHQVKPNGLLLLTFDLPGMQLEQMEAILSQKFSESPNCLSGANSKIVNNKYADLNCGFLAIRKCT